MLPIHSPRAMTVLKTFPSAERSEDAFDNLSENCLSKCFKSQTKNLAWSRKGHVENECLRK